MLRAAARRLLPGPPPLGGGGGGLAAGGPPSAAALAAELAQVTAGPLAPLQVRWAKKSKRKRNPKMSDRTPERLEASGGQKERIWDRYLMASETSFEMSRQVRQHVRGLTSDGRHNMRRKKDLSRYTNYRVLRAAGLTHDNPDEEVDRRGFVTPLTEMQDTSNLPRSPLHRRFLFPHTLSYKVYWGPPSVYDEPNQYEGSMVGCSVAARLGDLPLTQQQKERLVDVLGPKRVDERTGVFALEVDDFAERNHNAALLGDMLEKLLHEASSADAASATGGGGEDEPLELPAPARAAREAPARGKRKPQAAAKGGSDVR